MRKLIIEKAAVRANMAVIKERARGAALYGVLTGDGGGAGLTELARLIRDEGISRFAVGTVEEAQALRAVSISPCTPRTGRSWSGWWT